MKIIRKHLKGTSILMTFCILFISCEKYDDGILKSNHTKNNENLSFAKNSMYSGEEIFKGLFFMDNQISDGISQIKAIKTEILRQEDGVELIAQLSDLRDISVDFINDNYPNHFENLQTAVYSENYFEIEQKVKESAMMIEQAGLASTKYSSAFEFGKEIRENEQLRNELYQLDLTNENDVQTFHNILDDYNINYTSNSLVFFAAALAVFYAAVAAVSIAVAAYSLITKVAYWDAEDWFKTNENSEIDKELFISEIGSFFSK